MPVFDLVTTDDNSETVSDIMQRVIGATSDQVDADIEQVASGGPTPALMINGASNGTTIPDNMLAMYRQFYAQSVSVQHTTGLSYSDSLAAGGWLPYDGQGS
jgi:hypothetical protein